MYMDFYELMLIYQDVFNPKYFILLAATIIIFYDWKNSRDEILQLFGRLAVMGVCYIIGFSIMEVLLNYYLSLHPDLSSPDSPLQYLEDVSAIIGMSIGLMLGAVAWKKFGYGAEVLGGVVGLICVSVPFTVISYFWNISGHVTFTAAPVTYLTAIDRRLAFMYVVPLIMVVNRPVVGAHDWLQSIAGFVLGVSLMLPGIRYYLKLKRSSD